MNFEMAKQVASEVMMMVMVVMVVMKTCHDMGSRVVHIYRPKPNRQIKYDGSLKLYICNNYSKKLLIERLQCESMIGGSWERSERCLDKRGRRSTPVKNLILGAMMMMVVVVLEIGRNMMTHSLEPVIEFCR